MLLTGRARPGARLADKGQVNQSFPNNDPLREVKTAARKIAQNASIAAKLTKVARNQDHQGLEAALRWESPARLVTLVSSGLLEGLAANRERRVPKFTGS
jgi:enoyl-CoA hydratase